MYKPSFHCERNVKVLCNFLFHGMMLSHTAKGRCRAESAIRNRTMRGNSFPFHSGSRYFFSNCFIVFFVRIEMDREKKQYLKGDTRIRR